MPELYLTPASISYLNQFLLACLITIYLGKRHLERGRQTRRQQDNLLLVFFVALTFFLLLLFLEVSFLPAERLVVVSIENTVLGLVLVALIQFAYHFPISNDKQKVERGIALVISCAYALWEALIAVRRFHLLQDGLVVFRAPYMDILIVAEFAWVVLIFIRNSIQNWKLSVARRFALIFLIPLWLAVLNYHRLLYEISTPFYHINVSLGVLFAIFFFALNYLTSQPEQTSFVVKLSGAVLTSVMAVFGTVAWLAAPAYASQYSPSIVDHRTLRFIPSERGGYEVSEIPFRFEEDLGQNLNLTVVNSLKALDFDFPLFGQPYQQVFISHDGAIGLGAEFTWRDFQYHFANNPMIFPLLVDLDPNTFPDGGVFLHEKPDRIIVTYYKMPARNHPDAEYTFQVTLFSNGNFDFTYNGLPDMRFYVDDRPEATAWAIGVKPARTSQDSANFSNLPLWIGPGGMIQDEYRSFRIYLHEFVLPIAAAVLVSGLLFLIALPLIMLRSFARPLNSLLKGVEAFNRGQRDVTIPFYVNDEIGYLANSFNRMSAELDGMIADLESRVAARTSALRESEMQYRQIFDLESDAIFIIRNADGQILEANNAAVELYGYTRDELVMRRNTDLSAEPEATHKATHSPIPTDQIVKIPLRWHRKKDGTLFPISITARFITWKNESVHLAAIRDITEQHRFEQELAQLAVTDALTGLPNRRHFFAQAEPIFARSNQPPYALAVLMLDLDHFKKVNDQYGHAAGDAALCEAGRILSENLRPTDLLARFGGEEFAILLPRTPGAEAYQVAQRLCETLAEQTIHVDGIEIRVTVSIGVSILDGTVASLDELLSRADQALYEAKNAGRNRYETRGG